ncbi:MAG: hypothetical protein E7Z89_02120 [Cyanobacteria bacterium SIG28]|nr:hypothetical protein [Cyanobacteria bacterium SIG28]
MKKLIILLGVLIALPILVTGCSKSYKTVQEYADEMTKVKESNISYVFEGKLKATKNGIEQPEQDFKYSLSNGKSKIEFQNQQALYFDGKEIMAYQQGQNMLLVIFTEKMLNSIPEKERTLLFNIMTFGGLLYNWDSPTGSQETDNYCPLVKAKFKKNTRMNGYQCRLITFGNEENDFYSESCVNDEFGVAVYTKLKAQSKGEGNQIVINVNSINTNTITEYDVNPPAHLKRYTMAELFSQMGAAFSKFGR